MSRIFPGLVILMATLPPLRADEPKPKEEPVAFFLVGDTLFLADKEDTAKLDERSRLVTGRLVDLLNKLPGTDIPPAAGGGVPAARRRRRSCSR